MCTLYNIRTLLLCTECHIRGNSFEHAMRTAAITATAAGQFVPVLRTRSIAPFTFSYLLTYLLTSVPAFAKL